MTNLKAGLLLFSFMAGTLVLNAQNLEYSFSLYTQNDGLASGTITRIEKDSTGFLWLMTEKGLTRFDGYDFVIYRHDPNNPKSIPAHYVLDMKVNSLKEVFFRTENHISFYKHSTSSFSTVFTFLPGNEFRDWVAVDSAIWITTRSGLFKLTGSGSVVQKISLGDEAVGKINILNNDKSQKLIWIACKNSIVAVDAANSNRVFMQTLRQIPKATSAPILMYNNQANQTCFFSKQGYFRLDNDDSVFVQYNSTQADLSGKYSLVQAMDFDENYLVIALMDGTIVITDKNSGSESLFQLSDYADKNLATSKPSINGIYRSSDQNLWISTPSSGIYYADLNAAKFQVLKLNGTINSLTINPFCNYMLNDGRLLWISIAGSGLIKGESFFPYFRSYKPEQISGRPISPLYCNVRTIIQWNDSMLFTGSLNNLSIFNLKTRKFEPALPDKLITFGLNKIPIGKIIKDDYGSFWIGSWNDSGLFKVSNDLKTVSHYSLFPTVNSQSNSIRSLAIIDKDIWIGTAASGLFIIRNYLDSASLVEKLPLSSFPEKQNIKSVYAILKKNESVYLGTNNGLLIYPLKERQFIRFMNQPGNYESLSYNDIRSLAFDNYGKLWIGTNGGGLNSFNPENKKFQNFNTENGLPDNFIYSIAVDASGNLWLGTNNGLCCFNPSTFQTQNFSAKDKLQNLEFNTGSCLNLTSGELCFGGIDGISIFHPDSVNAVYPPVNMVITNFRVDNRPVAYESNRITLKPAENNLTFEFAALNFFRNDETRYAYKLEGADRDWVFSGGRRFAHYSQLPPGEYTFYAKAMDKSGLWSPVFEFLHIHISTPWYKTWWFYLTLILAVSSFVYALFRFRLKQKLQVQLLRNKIARDLHDEIGSNLSSISLFSTVAIEKTTPADPETQSLLKKITEYTQISMEAMNDIVWMINTRNDRFENIIARMRELAVELFETKHIELEMVFDEQLAHQKMGMEERKNFYLIYKEALNNILKYSACRKVSIHLKSGSGLIKLEVFDDGKGFLTDTLMKGNGLANMKARAQMLKGNLEIISHTGKGTHLTLEFPA